LSSDPTDPLAWLDPSLQQLAQTRRYRYLQVRESPPVAGLVQLDGQQFVNFSSNDYLGIAADARLVDAVKSVVGQVGWGAGASPLVTGRGVWHRRLENELAAFKGTQAALLFPTGFATNVGTITALVGPGDWIYSDRNNHASIIDGCRLSEANVQIYEHGDCRHLQERLLNNHSSGRKLIVTDSLFSMDGDFAPLSELVEIAAQAQAMLMVDEAHATGVWGTCGRGVCERMQVETQIPIRVGTLSKALGSLGGFVCGSQRLIDWIANRARSYIFSTAQPEATAAASLASLSIIKSEPERRQRVVDLASRVREELTRLGWNCLHSQSQIIPLLVGDEAAALALSQRLREQGLLVPAIRPPAVNPGKCILRISLSAAHSDQQIEQLIAALHPSA